MFSTMYLVNKDYQWQQTTENIYNIQLKQKITYVNLTTAQLN